MFIQSTKEKYLKKKYENVPRIISNKNPISLKNWTRIPIEIKFNKINIRNREREIPNISGSPSIPL